MHFAQIVLPAILLAVCRAQTLDAAPATGNNEEYVADAGETSSTGGLDDASADVDAIGNQWFRHLELQQKREQLIGQYRFMIAKSLLRLKDACKVYDWFVANEEPQSMFGMGQTERGIDDMRVPPINTERYIQAILNQLQAQSQHQISDTFSRQNSTDPALNVLYYFVSASSMIKDNRLDGLLAAMLFEKCCSPADEPNSPCRRRDFEEGNMLKRDNAPPKKARFHSWGGKRSSEAKVVIRTPFHSWGGK